MFIMGALVPRWTRISLKPVLVTAHHATYDLQALLDQLLPGLLPLGLTLGCVWLLRRHVKPFWLLLGILGLSILGYWGGLFK
jgi:Phosphotransferase system, mannose/fructose/N-acetylgalactosamine-specific component IID